MPEPVLDEALLVNSVAFEADNDRMLGFDSVRALGAIEGDRDTSDWDGNREISGDNVRLNGIGCLILPEDAYNLTLVIFCLTLLGRVNIEIRVAMIEPKIA